jgi:hypothetical protein
MLFIRFSFRLESVICLKILTTFAPGGLGGLWGQGPESKPQWFGINSLIISNFSKNKISNFSKFGINSLIISNFSKNKISNFCNFSKNKICNFSKNKICNFFKNKINSGFEQFLFRGVQPVFFA